MVEPRFPHPRRETILRAVHALPLMGRSIAPKSSYACVICRRRIGPLGRLPCPGFPTCDSTSCELSRLSAVAQVFSGGPYGSAKRRSTIGSFARLVSTPSGSVMVQRQPIIERADPLIDAFLRLLRWQEAFDAYERWNDPVRYARGIVQFLPPRTLDQVLAMRSHGPLVPLDPVEDLPSDERDWIQRCFTGGEPGILEEKGPVRRPPHEHAPRPPPIEVWP